MLSVLPEQQPGDSAHNLHWSLTSLFIYIFVIPYDQEIEKENVRMMILFYLIYNEIIYPNI